MHRLEVPVVLLAVVTLVLPPLGQQAGEPGRAAPVVQGREELDKPPEGFKRHVLEGSGYAVFLPEKVEEMGSGPKGVQFWLKLGEPPGLIFLSRPKLIEGGSAVDVSNAPALLDKEESSFMEKMLKGAERVEQQETTIGGRPARVVEFTTSDWSGRVRGQVAYVVTPRGTITVMCQGPEDNAAKIQPVCQTVVKSIRMQ